MNGTTKNLEIKIARFEKIQQASLRARTEMRQAVRECLAGIDKSDLSDIARRMNISIVQLSNLKGGYSIPSLATAKEVLRVTC